MKLYFIRHGDPDYANDTLTPYGFKEVEFLADYLQNIKIDKIYASPINRAKFTAEATAKRKNMDIEFKEFLREDVAWKYFGNKKDPATWDFFEKEIMDEYISQECLDAGDEWYKLPFFNGKEYDKAVEYYKENIDSFMLELGYRHDHKRKAYIKEKDVYQNVAIFAHGGAGMAIMPALFDIARPLYVTNFIHLDTTGIIEIDFGDDEIARPRIYRYNDVAHLKGIKKSTFKLEA